MNNEILLQIITGIFATVAIILNNKKMRSNIDAESRMLKNMIAELQQDVSKLFNFEKEIKKADNFRMTFRNLISEMASKKISESETLSKSKIVINSITDFAKELTEFGLKFYYSGYRKNDRITKDEFYNYLQTDMNSILFNFIEKLEAIKTEKALKVGNNIQLITFIELFSKNDGSKEPDCFALTELLIMRLIQNGLNESEFQQVVLTYFNNFFKKFKEKYLLFLELSDYETEIEKHVV